MGVLLSNRTVKPRTQARPRLERTHRSRPARPGRGLPAGRQAPALAPDDHAAEQHPARHGAAEDHGQASAVPDHLARRRRAPRRVHLPLLDRRAGARDPARARRPGALHAHEQAGRRADLERSRRRREAGAARSLRALDLGSGHRGEPGQGVSRSRSRRSATSCSRARGSSSRRAAGSRSGCRPTPRGCAGSCTAATACSRAGRCIFARRSRRASSTCTSSPGTHAARSTVVVG